MKKIVYNILILTLVTCFSSCDESIVDQVEYITFSSGSYSTGVAPGGNADFDVTVYASNISSNDRTVSLALQPSTNAPDGSYSVPSSVTIPAGSNEASFAVSVTDNNNLDCFNDVVFGMVNSDDYYIGDNSTLTFYQTPSDTCNSEVSGSLDFVFDAYASEVSYEILDVLGNVVIAGPDSAYADGDVSASIPVTLCSGRCYSLVVYDAFGDGLASPGEFTLTIGGTVYATGGGDFGDSTSTGFQVD